jgi:four helix bundle protein
MTPSELKKRTFLAALRIVQFVQGLPQREPRLWVLGRQLLESGTSTAAQYRAACRAQSTRDFISKMKKMEEEADESTLWLALLHASGLPPGLSKDAVALQKEFDELTAIAVSSVKSARTRLRPIGNRIGNRSVP